MKKIEITIKPVENVTIEEIVESVENSQGYTILEVNQALGYVKVSQEVPL